ncbi:hypothetical protein [Andreprevotia chitinilytica]|uniref:hypothetical protein n=1 Tax=Andreprevotia chitinilytica TaxID=396808 RepID=UPI000553D927|nr:hypothetical protein [Andreprevotia chitinilytica]
MIDARRDYILARDHGWLEISLKVDGIPDQPPVKGKSQAPGGPDSCFIGVAFNKEKMISTFAEAIGDKTPYSLDTGYRFAVPARPGNVSVSLEGCIQKPRQAELKVDISKGTVYNLAFDGTSLKLEGQHPFDSVTLDSLNGKLANLDDAQAQLDAAVAQSRKEMLWGFLGLGLVVLLAAVWLRRRK